jgi:predicted glutamine amidotransferase
MCGIFGYVGSPTRKTNGTLHKFLYHLAHASEARGTHSTGFAARHDSGLIVADKLPYRGSTFCTMSGKFQSLKRKMPTTFIGHTRYGTGSNPRINNNNHPFFGKDFHMVHNGVIPSWRDIGKKEDVLERMGSETDSEIVLRILESRIEKDKRDKIPFKKHVEYILDNVWGNMAIALLDINSPNVWLFRNENPINVFTVPAGMFGGEITFFCSTKDIFKDAWKACFNRGFGKDVSSERFLQANQLFRLSTEATIVQGDKAKKFLWYKISVKKPFYKNKQYYGGSNHSSGNGTRPYIATGKPIEFFSSVLDATLPEMGCRFTKEKIRGIKKAMSGSGDNSNIRVDGFTVPEFKAINAAWQSIKAISIKAEQEKEKQDVVNPTTCEIIS